MLGQIGPPVIWDSPGPGPVLVPVAWLAQHPDTIKAWEGVTPLLDWHQVVDFDRSQ